jgi:hypothetical protein
MEEAPAWLTGLIDSVVEASISNGLTDYNTLVQSVHNAVEAINIATNTYVSRVEITPLVDGIVTSKLETINATYEANFATKVELTTAIATTETAIAQNISDLSVGINNTVNARISEVQTAIATETSVLANDITVLETAFEDQESNLSATASAVSGLQTYIGVDPSSSPNGTGMLARIRIIEKQNDGVIETFTGTHDVMLGIENPNNITDNDELDISQEPYASWLADDLSSGTIETRSLHVGDVFVKYSSTDTGYRSYEKAYKFIKTAVDTTSPYSTDAEGFTWALIVDTDAQNAYVAALNALDLADDKRRVFVNTPYAPYDEGDLWLVQAGAPIIGTNLLGRIIQQGDMLRCLESKVAAGTYENNDWVPADSYREAILAVESGLNSFIQNDYSTFVEDINAQVDKKAESFYQSTVPSGRLSVVNVAANSSLDKYVGDLWKNTYTGTVSGYLGNNTEYIYTKTANGSNWNYGWAEMEVPDIVFDTIDTKKSIYTGNAVPAPVYPDSLEINDIWVTGESPAAGYIAKSIYMWNGTMFVAPVRYTDDQYAINIRNGVNKIDLGEHVDSLGWNSRITANEEDIASISTNLVDKEIEIALLDTKITEEEQARILAISAEELARVTAIGERILAEATLDGKITAEEQARLAAVNEVEEAYKEYSRVVTLAIADGALTPEEQVLITSASAAVQEAKSRLLAIEASANAYSDGILDDFLVATYAKDLLNISNQIDGVAVTYFQDTEPYTALSGEIANAGDVWFVPSTGAAYKFVYKTLSSDGVTVLSPSSWDPITNTNVLDALVAASTTKAAADRSIKNYTSEPTTPYYVGDTWMQGSTGDIYVCSATRESGTFSSNDWSIASRYTDDSAVTLLETGLANGSVAIKLTDAYVGNELLTDYVSNQLDSLVVVYSGSDHTTQSGMKTDDIYIEKGTATTSSGVRIDVVNTYKYDGAAWNAIGNNDDIIALADLADGKRSVYSGSSTPELQGYLPVVRDLWIPSSDNSTFEKGEVYQYDGATWVLATRYTEDLLGFADVVSNTIVPALENQIDGKVEYWFNVFADKPNTAWTTSEERNKHDGDIWYITDIKTSVYYSAAINDWVALEDQKIIDALIDAANAKGAADGKVSQLYAWGGVNAPADYALADGSIVTADNFTYWYKAAEGKMYIKSNLNWVEMPTVFAVDGTSYLSQGDLATVFNPLTGDISAYSFNGTSWQTIGPEGITSKSSFLVALENDVRGETGSVTTALSQLESSTNAYTNNAVTGVESKFAYNSKLRLDDGKYYNSGFGINASSSQSVGTGSEEDPYTDSEFWVNADRFKIAGTNGTGLPVFGVDTTTNTITINGSVRIGGTTVSEAPSYYGSLSVAPAGVGINEGSTYYNSSNGIVYSYANGEWVSTKGEQGVPGVNLLPRELSTFGTSEFIFHKAPSSDVVFSTDRALFSDKSLKLTANAYDSWVYFGEGGNNVAISPNRRWMLSTYVYSTQAGSNIGELFLLTGTSYQHVNVVFDVLEANTWVRVFGIVDLTSYSDTSAQVRVDNNLAGNVMYFDGLMLEEYVGQAIPSAYMLPPSMGSTGADGQTYYTWVKYADTPTSGMSDYPSGKSYLGIAYNKPTSTESTSYGDYSWALIKGEAGIQGPAGEDGQPTYTWIKYADSASGTGLSDNPANKAWIGIAVNKLTPTESTNAADYSWALIKGEQGPAGEDARYLAAVQEYRFANTTEGFSIHGVIGWNPEPTNWLLLVENDAFIYREVPSFSGSENYIVRARLWSDTALSGRNQLYFTTTESVSSTTFEPSRGVESAYRDAVAGQWYDVEFDLSANALWVGKTITGLRLDFIEAPAHHVRIEYLSIGRYGVAKDGPQGPQGMLPAPTGAAGLFANSNYLGYHDGESWQAWIGSTGNFYFEDGFGGYITNLAEDGQTATTLRVKGHIEATSGKFEWTSINNVSVNSLQIQEEAIIVPRSSYTRAGTVFSTGWVEMDRVTFPAQDVATKVLVTYECTAKYGGGNGSIYGMYPQFEYFSSLSSSALNGVMLLGPVYHTGSIRVPFTTIVDVPANTSVDFYFRVKRGDGNGYGQGECYDRIITVMGVKR